MKTNLRSFVFILLTVAGGMGLLAGNAQAVDEAMPPEVKALIGMKIPAKAPKTVGDIPDWKITGGGMLVGYSNAETNFGYELRHKGNVNIFWIDTMDVNYNRVILDVRVLPQQLLFYDIKDDKIVPKKTGAACICFSTLVRMIHPKKR